MAFPSQFRDRSQPYRLAHGPVSGFQEAQGAAIDLASTLLLAGVKKRLANQIMVGALRRNHPTETPIPGATLRALLSEAVDDAKFEESRIRSMDKEEKLDSQKRSGIEALAAVLRAYFKDWRVDPDYKEIDCHWTGIVEDGPEPGPDPITIPFGRGSLSEATATLFRHIGPPEIFVTHVYGAAKPKDLIPAFLLCAQKAPARDKGDQQSEPVTLVQAILHMICWYNPSEEDLSKGLTQGYKVRLNHKPGIYATEGVAYIMGANGDMELYVIPTAVVPHLPKHLQGKRDGDVKRLLFQAPGYFKTTKEGWACPNWVREKIGTWRTAAINIRVFNEELDKTQRRQSEPPVAIPLDPNDDGREPAPIVTPYTASAEQNTAFMLADVPPASDSRLAAGRDPLAHAQQHSLTLLVSENPVSFHGDSSVSGQDRDAEGCANVRDGEIANDSRHFASHGGSHK